MTLFQGRTGHMCILEKHRTAAGSEAAGLMLYTAFHTNINRELNSLYREGADDQMCYSKMKRERGPAAT